MKRLIGGSNFRRSVLKRDRTEQVLTSIYGHAPPIPVLMQSGPNRP